MMAQIFKRDSVLPVKDAADGECVQPGTIYLAPADHHLGRMILKAEEKNKGLEVATAVGVGRS